MTATRAVQAPRPRVGTRGKKRQEETAAPAVVDPAEAPATIDAYIAAAPAATRPVLSAIRRTIRASAPGAREIISYRMPAFKARGVLVYFAAFKAHIGLYPPVAGSASLMKAIAPYAGPKGNLKFPLDRPMPYALIARIVRLRVKQDLAKRGRDKMP